MRKFFTLAALLACAVQVHAASVTVQADDTVGVSFFADPTGALNNLAIASNPNLAMAVTNGDDLLIGNTVLVGAFHVSDAEIQSHATDVGYLISNFIQFGDVAKIGDTYNQPGIFSSTLTGSSDSLNLDGEQIYVFVLGSTDNSTFARSLTTAFQVGIYYVDMAFNSAWAFRADSAIPNSTTIDLADLTVGGNGTQLIPNSAHVVLGSFGADNSNVLTGKNFSLASVPEPGSAWLAVSGVLALLGRRRPQRAM